MDSASLSGFVAGQHSRHVLEDCHSNLPHHGDSYRGRNLPLAETRDNRFVAAPLGMTIISRIGTRKRDLIVICLGLDAARPLLRGEVLRYNRENERE